MRRLLAFACGLAAVGLAVPAVAQDPALQARALFERGVAAMDRGAPAEAALYFEQSYRLVPRASTACNMASAQERLGRPCDAQRWFEQCAAIDTEGNARDHARREASRIAPQCSAATGPIPRPHDPFVRAPVVPSVGTAPPSGSVQVVEAGYPTYPPPSVDHTLLGLGIGAFVLGAGAIVGGAFSALEAESAAGQIQAPPGPIMAGTPDADLFYRAATFSDLALGLYIGGGLLGALGVVLTIVDLARPGALGGRAANGRPSWVLLPTPTGGLATLTVQL
jgi:hypothetical protein